MTTAEILAKAADLIEPEGVWQQSPDDAHHCAASAIGWVSGNIKASEFDYMAYREAYNLLARRLGVKSIAQWNDAPERTQAEVVQALRDAAKSAGVA